MGRDEAVWAVIATIRRVEALERRGRCISGRGGGPLMTGARRSRELRENDGGRDNHQSTATYIHLVQQK